ncbi:probable E3 ubiquitin-protein ligase makorin-1 isoform X2 [Ornithodoros turicata]|uniref:probable E3 ubiquitin-protein ligase makorin-1 isoform X2 n=1 Tax=Ornithodoros turicata TaxID=34597 RepID=UPI003139542A
MAEGGSESVLCRYFLSGACRDGAGCHFSHDRSLGVVDNVCRYYLKGECFYGNRCRYDHIRTGRNNLHNRGGRGNSRNQGGHRNHGNQQGCHRRENCATQPSTASGSRGNAVPAGSSAKSYASMVRPQQEVAEPTEFPPLCPYESASGCPFGDKCTYLHGEMCDLCQKPCLHPTSEAQRKKHREECLEKHERDMELSFAVQRSATKSCGICMDVVMEKEPPPERRFGILEKCSHVFCLSCIRKWRGTRQFETKTVRACPECRVPSDFVTPSSFWVDMGEEKDKLIADYKKALSAKPCRYFKEGRGECPFAGACFYRHAYPDGSKAILPPPRPRRRQNQEGELEIMERLVLWDFFDFHDDHDFLSPFSLEDVLEIITETEDDSDSDWSDIDIFLN